MGMSIRISTVSAIPGMGGRAILGRGQKNPNKHLMKVRFYR